jgi:hypothetical protein
VACILKFYLKPDHIEIFGIAWLNLAVLDPFRYCSGEETREAWQWFIKAGEKPCACGANSLGSDSFNVDDFLHEGQKPLRR